MPENVNTSALVVEGQTEKQDDRPIMIKVDHVSMSFNMASEQLNSLKEYMVAIARRKLFFEEFKALDDVSFEVRKGDVFGIMGTNGSGKSTILKIIAGVLEPTKGTCQVNGNIAPLIELGAGFDMDLSARENIYLNGALLGYSKEFIDENFDAIVEFAEVEKFLDMPLKNYSSGMVARIAFAIATVIVPEILVVDEVLSVGDFMFQKKCEDRITELIEQHGVTVLIVSHSNDQVARLCNKAIWIEKGHERLQGDADMVCRVYGGLGGRTGSKEAEERVFEALIGMDKIPDEEEKRCKVMGGESANSAAVKLARKGWNVSSLDALALVCDKAHVNALVANPLAGALGVPVLPCGDERISDAVEQFLYEVKPKTVYFFDCGHHAGKVKELVSRMPWEIRIVAFEKESVFSFSSEVFEYGKEKAFWSNRAAFFAFEDCLESMVASPLLYRQSIPSFVIDLSEPDWEGLSQRLADCGISEVLAIGKSGAGRVESHFENPFKVNRIESASLSESCLSTSMFVSDEFSNGGPFDISLAPLSPAMWQELITVGGFSSQMNAPLVLMDGTNLDSMDRTMKCVGELCSNRSVLYFVAGKNGLGEIEQRLLLEETLSS